jgi:hypothetical protein
MTIERALRLIAGAFIILSTALAYTVSPRWLLLTAFVGLNLLQSGFTDWCPMVWILDKAGLAHCAAVRSSASLLTPMPPRA